MSDEFNKLNGKPALATFTGKPLSMGGIEGRSYSTAKGGEFILERAIEKYKLPQNSRVIIQGFGNAGGHLADFLHKKGFKKQLGMLVEPHSKTIHSNLILLCGDIPAIR